VNHHPRCRLGCCGFAHLEAQKAAARLGHENSPGNLCPADFSKLYSRFESFRDSKGNIKIINDQSDDGFL